MSVGRWKGEGRGGGDLGKTEKGGLTQGRSLSCVKLQSLRKEAKKMRQKAKKGAALIQQEIVASE